MLIEPKAGDGIEIPVQGQIAVGVPMTVTANGQTTFSIPEGVASDIPGTHFRADATLRYLLAASEQLRSLHHWRPDRVILCNIYVVHVFARAQVYRSDGELSEEFLDGATVCRNVLICRQHARSSQDILLLIKLFIKLLHRLE